MSSYEKITIEKSNASNHSLSYKGKKQLFDIVNIIYKNYNYLTENCNMIININIIKNLMIIYDLCIQ